MRQNELMPQPANPKHKLCVVEFNVPGARSGGTDKGPNGHRIDSIPIANGVIKAGGSCEIIKYYHDKHDEFAARVVNYDALIVRINPGQLSQGTSEGTQRRFDDLMNQMVAMGKPVWSSPGVQTKMGAKDALCKIANMKCGLVDTFAYYDAETLETQFKKTMAFQPRVLKQNRGSAGEGIWLCWLDGKEYCKNFGDASLEDSDKLKLMEMNDNHVEYHTVKEFLAFCVDGPDAPEAGTWHSTFPGQYLKGGAEAGGQLVDQRLLPRISEGEVRVLMTGDVCQMIIHKKPEGGLSAVGGNSAYTYYEPTHPKYADLLAKLVYDIDHGLMEALGLGGEPLPLLWTCDYIPKDAEDGSPGVTEYVVGEFNCSCVGVSKFQAVCGGDKTLADVPDEDYFDACKLTDLMGRQAIKMLEQSRKRYDELMPQPANPKHKLCVVEFNVPGARSGGTDKGPNGHRIDSIPIANGVIKAGGSCEIIKYYHDKHDEFAARVVNYDALIVRINPGQLSQGTSEGTQRRFDDLMNQMVAMGKPVWSSPGVQTKMGAKDALCKIANMKCGLVDTFAYYDAETLETQFKKTMAFQPRVLKQNRGSAGEGIWLCWLDGKEYCKNFGDASLEDSDKLKLMEMNDNHVEYHTVKEFLAFCVDGPDAPEAGTWHSTFPGQYLKGGAEAGGQLVDQRLLPRISEGEVRVLMTGDVCQMIIHKKPEGGLSAVGGNSAYTYYEPTHPKYADLLAKLIYDIDHGLMEALGLGGEPLPLLWTCDYIPKDAEDGSPGVTEYVVGEFNCSCVGVSKFQAVCGGDKTLADVPDEDYFDACRLTDLMGRQAIKMLEQSRKRYDELMPQPANPKHKLCVVEFNVPGARSGGTDKGPNGHRIDSIPIANGVIKAGGSCEIIKYYHDKHDEFAARVVNYDALIVRINPGQLSQGTSEGTQRRFDDLMNQMVAMGKPVWSSPGVQTKMGAKDALCKIANMKCGLVDTFAYYDAETLETQFKKTMAFQPRVLKQNRGSAGEGIWLCWLDGKEYCKNFGDASLEDSDKLKLMEMNDNHVEYHTVKEFLAFCVDGPDAPEAGTWHSTFPGQYLKGGAEAGGQLVDQRLLPRISEGEVRVLMTGDVCQMIIHKKPEGGLSAVGGNSAYTYYEPTHPKYADLLAKLIYDIDHGLMEALGLGGEPLPLLWTCDYIPKDAEEGSPGVTEYVVGEFNCSCVGVSKFQAVCGGDKTLADVPDEDYFDACRLTDLMGRQAIKMLEQSRKRYDELMPQPANPKHKLCVVEFNVPGARSGGTDKGPNGHRIDSIPIANGVIKAGGSCEIIKYYHDKHDEFAARVVNYDALIVRINPGQLSQGTSEGTQRRFDDLMNQMVAMGKPVWSSPGVQTKMGAKDALCKIANMKCGLVDTFAYYDAETLETQFKKTMAFQPRVLKQNRGSAGEGIWLCWLDGKEYCKNFGDASLEDSDKLKLMEMNDNHVEYHTVKEFLAFCVDGPDAPEAGTWHSTFPGQYLKGGAEAGGQLVDQRLLPRISEGEVRVLMTGDVCQMIIHKKPEGGLSAVGGNSAYTYYEPTHPKYADLLAKLIYDIDHGLMEALGLGGEPLPLLWTCDYIPKDAEDGSPGVTEYVVGEFNCSCVGVSKFQAVCGGDKTLADVPDEDYFDACRLTDLMGRQAIKMLEQSRKRYDELMPQPANPKHKLCVVEFNVPGARSGGTDKGPNGHRIDSIPIANGVIKAGGSCEIIKYYHDKHDEFAARVVNYDALIVRINPGQLSQGTSEGTQRRFDDLMNQMVAMGKPVWSSPGVQTKMGAKDALCKIANMKCGLVDTFAYYDAETLETQFKKTMAFQPRVLKQNRGSAGEGIWLCWLDGKEYCKNFGDASLEDSDKLKLMEMNDNHVEYHTVKEFLAFCVDGPDAPEAGTWHSTFPGQYLKGGAEAGGQLVDQRLLPRISEGEVRVLMTGDVCQMIIHKKPEGGLSAVGGNSAYTYYEPTHPKYADLLAKLIYDIDHGLMEALGLGGEPLPLLWTCDYIPKDAEDGSPGVTEYVVGEFNCSCVGVSKFQAVCGGDKTLADVPDEDYFDACRLTDLMGRQAIKMLEQSRKRYDELMPQPANPKHKLCVVEFNVPGARSGGTDKGPNGHRIDSIPIANGVIKAGGSCEIIKYYHDKHDEFAARVVNYDALIVRINPGQLSQGTSEGTQRRFDDLMNQMVAMGKPVWSSPGVQTKMGAKDALCKIANMKCGLVDTFAYYDAETLETQFKKTMAFQPRVLKQNRGSAGEGIWLCWLDGKEYCKNFGDASLEDSDKLKLMEMNDNHVEYHTVKEFLAFCVDGPDAPEAGTWHSTFPGQYLKGGAEAGGQLVDQRLLPRISEGEVRVLMTGDVCQMIIHKKPEGGLSAVGGNSAYTYYEPTHPKYADLLAKLIYDIDHGLMEALGLGGEPLPLLWTCDYIPKDAEEGSPGVTEYVVGEFNCSCVGVSKFQAVCGGDKTLADVPDEDYFDACRLTDLMGRQAIKMLEQSRKRYDELMPQPANPKHKLCVVEFNVPGARSGGTDKGPNGHRIDSIPIANGVIKAGGSCEIIKYYHDKHDEFAARVVNYDALIVRINPGQLSQGTSEGTQRRFDDLMNQMVAMGKPVWSSPGVQTKMGAKDALCKIANMKCGLVDTFAYYDAETLETQFKKTMAFQPRVLKQNRGSAGEGIWLCWLDGKEYCKNFGDASLEDSDKLKLMEMNDNHVEYHTVKEFLAFCVDGPDAPEAGTWHSTFPGQYLKGGAEAGGQLVDQRLLPRISEGEVRVLMTGDVCQMIIHKKPEGGLSAVGGNSAYTYYEPTHPKYADLLAKLIYDIDHGLMEALGLGGEPLPLLWTCDYIPKDAEDGSPGVTEYVVGEFNCSCVGVSKFQAVCGGDKTLADVPDEDYFDACRLTDLMGRQAIKMLEQSRKRYDELMPQPANPKHKLCVVEFNVPGARSGGTDKGPNGHRIDSIPIANGVIKAGGSCEIIKYYHDKHDEFAARVVNYDALIVRINPGQLSQGTSEGTQRRFDDLMNQMVAMGKPVWSSPGVQTKMGAKDALCKIANMKCGLVDTFAYYDAETLETQFKKTMAFQPRVLKQNRGSAGEGIWLCWLDGKEYCKNFGDASLEDSDKLKLMEMNDNHVEYHTVKEFLAFCVDGPDAPEAGTWHSTFPGQYLKGGAEAGGQLVDQRLLPRISEGEVRVLMTGDVCQMIIHKKPEGGLSAVGGNSAYTYYEPTHPKYADLLAKLVYDIDHGLMEALGLGGEPLPLLWTCDYIPKDAEDGSPGVTEYVVGEFNCSCVGVSKFQAVCGGDKTLADVPDEDYFDACKLTDLMGRQAIKMLEQSRKRYDELMPQPANPKHKLCVVEFNVPGARSGGTDKGPNGHRIDSIPIANGVIKAGGSCEIIKYYHDKHDEFAARVVNYDALIVRINPGQLSQGTSEGTQRRFDDLMNQMVAMGKPVWSSPGVQTKMGAKDALCKIANMKCGLVDTFAYYDAETLETQFKKTMAFQPRVLKQNRGSAGEGIWLCWLDGKEYCKNFGDASLEDSDKLKLMEMNDNHAEYHTVKEFPGLLRRRTRRTRGRDGWHSTFPGQYLRAGAEAGGQLVDQRLLPRISEGEYADLLAKLI
ncbi:hypothetical protein CTAYLR_010228 [Chrysophaeum taylorii]|uniref:DUF6815 domain-containing protein n=1 Tax=Chrysophaeum taylorii TaxID=2483200 RepID=A0AAD7U6I2_9STRA|nr:hypothetical protein CTAYLR_010228 [Chrysophaeum taylorii]